MAHLKAHCSATTVLFGSVRLFSLSPSTSYLVDRVERTTTLCRYINYKWVSINISYICHVEHHMTPAIDKRGIITYSYHKERTKKIKKVNSQGMGGYHPRFCLTQKYKLHTDLVSRLVPYQTPVSRLVPYQTPEMNKEA